MRFLLIISLFISYVVNSQVVADTLIFIQTSGDTVKVVTYKNASTSPMATIVRLTDTAEVLRGLIDLKEPLLGFTPYNATNPNGYISSVPAQTFASITGKPTTLLGYGITDAYPLAGNPSSFLVAADIAGKQNTLVSGTNIKTVNGSTLLGSGDIAISGTAAWGSVTGTLSNQPDLQTALDLKLPKTTTSGVGSSPTASSTTTVTHNLGRVPSVIRIYGYGSFTSNAAATATTSSMGIFSSSGNFCVYQRYGSAITTTQAGLSSSVFAILLATGGGNFISGVIQNVTLTQFDIQWTETGTATAQPYLWEAQQP